MTENEQLKVENHKFISSLQESESLRRGMGNKLKELEPGNETDGFERSSAKALVTAAWFPPLGNSKTEKSPNMISVNGGVHFDPESCIQVSTEEQYRQNKLVMEIKTLKDGRYKLMAILQKSESLRKHIENKLEKMTT